MRVAATLLALGVWLVVPEVLSACAVCYGAEDSLMTAGLNNGILALLAVIGTVQVGFVALFVNFRQRSKKLADPHPATAEQPRGDL